MKQQELYKGDGISGAALKWIAIITMTIDHIGVGLISHYNRLLASDLTDLYTISRLIGRLAFPIFVFLIVQGYQHTSDLRKYLTRLLIFALISEIPFDLMATDQLVNMGHQNIFFTLFLGVSGLALFDYFERENKTIEQFIPLIVALFLSEVLNVDYGWYGVLFIFGVGILRDKKVAQTIFGVVMGSVQMLFASFAFLPIWFYNGKRGRQNKWFFYLYYPGHLLVIYLIRQFLIT